ncbi:MAG TPA: tRNA (adenosine(37)-N6)-dimethylallyltransferase MiaA [Bacteroidales bacterium]|jgi:tRNA dimethylallyltransferase|nr:tRNA (adenosine(37)-N6)-dimethylallyltransferase MiaA [Bacteroidales bacterium]HOL99048.1 tRNA (adenosine(37)-N6)-dimethylallyltransferase MiaA [Bacteroidales bacterium]HOM37439.1 tRNA (adenosine(37)-N6)-dimethylallyltransferase MiaA [Bacteroidales bacterium]HPD24917.1 tRNA (adenosine(37)-N6)-dimethylallyltransferase MiaA [Bacteroidales bacterium]HRT00618.1 tRNA (adenosine(37)-N6)-dimethylallyltransferase MiaA [Bacteroidales bacterium]
MSSKYDMIVITGATAGGKTSVAVNLAYKLNAEIISADSRQVYRGMDIGTGKDLDEYTINGVKIPVHLIDIVDAGYKYNVFEYCNDFKKVYNDIKSRGKLPVLCGGTGLYIESVLKNYQMIYVPVNMPLRKKLENLDLIELEKILLNYKPLHNKSDLDTKKRAIRAIEIADYYKKNNIPPTLENSINYIVFGILYDRDTRRKRISERLKYRLENGLIEEAIRLHQSGLSLEDMEYYGLEYKFLSYYLAGRINKEELFFKLNTAIHQFAKRQMTFFRKMEKDEIKIHWIDGNLTMKEKVEIILKTIKT